MSSKVSGSENDKSKYDFHQLRRELDKVLPYVNGFTRELTFNQIIFLAFLKSDESNREILKSSYPEHAHTYLSYKNPLYFLEK